MTCDDISNPGDLDPSVQQLVSDFIAQNGLTAGWRDPTSLFKIVDYLRAQNINTQVVVTDSSGNTFCYE